MKFVIQTTSREQISSSCSVYKAQSHQSRTCLNACVFRVCVYVCVCVGGGVKINILLSAQHPKNISESINLSCYQI